MSAYSTISKLVAPRVGEPQPAAALRLDAGLGQRGAHGLAVIDHEAEVAALIGTLEAPFGDSQELVAEIQERHPWHASAELEGEQPAVEVERGVEVADLERDVVDADEAGGGHISASRRTP